MPRCLQSRGKTEIWPAVWDALSARSAVVAGAETLFLSGSALAASMGFPDIGLIRVEDLLRATVQIVEASDLPLIVDIETGYGPLPALARLVKDLRRAGAGGVHIEDQEFTGQSVSSKPALCPTSTMIARIDTVRSAGADELIVLARSDVLGGDWPFETTLGRLDAYRQAGAQWTMPVFVRSQAELAAAAELNPEGTIAIAVRGASGYAPSVADSAQLGCRGLIVTGFPVAAFQTYKDLYELAMRGELGELQRRRVAAAQFEQEMEFGRHQPPQAGAAES